MKSYLFSIVFSFHLYQIKSSNKVNYSDPNHIFVMENEASVELIKSKSLIAPSIIVEEDKYGEPKEEIQTQLLEIGFEPEDVQELLRGNSIHLDFAIDTLLRRSTNKSRISSEAVLCSICQEPLKFDFIMEIPDCSDTFCKNCLTSYVQLRIVESQVLDMPCPNHECHSEITENLIKQLVSDEIFQKYLIFKNIEELSKDPFLRWCPKSDCKGYDIGNMDKKQLACNLCKYNYCYYCAEAWHPEKKCKASSEIEMDKWARNHGLKYCPNCRRKVQKALGCDHMTCVKCRYEWCWLCGDKYTGGHFEVCEIKNLKKKDPPGLIVAQYLFSPLILAFLPIVLAVVAVHKSLENPGSSYRMRMFLQRKWLSYPLAILVGIIVAPLFYALAPPVLSIWICINFYENCCCIVCSVLFGFVTGIIGIPFLIVAAILSSIIAHLIGIVLLIYKIFIFLRRCRDPYYLRPKMKYDYV